MTDYTTLPPESKLMGDATGNICIASVGQDDTAGNITVTHVGAFFSPFQPYAERAVACLQACAGLPDPSVVPEMLQLIREYDGTSVGLQGLDKLDERARNIIERCGEAK